MVPLPLPWESVTTDMSRTKAGYMQELVLACRLVGEIARVVGRVLGVLNWLI